MDLGLSNRVFLVTAASGGLGFATAHALAAEGAHVLIVGRNTDKVTDAVAQLGDTAAGMTADITDPATPQAAVAQTLDHFGRIDGAFVSVPGPIPGRVTDIDDDQWDQAFGHVFQPALRTTRAVLAENPASVFGFVLSTSVKTPLPNMAPSNALRPGLAMVIKQLADEIGPDGGRAFGVMPGSIATDRIVFLDSQKADPETARAEAMARIPLRRYGEPAEFGRVAAFLMSPAASYVTGCVIPVDGGVLRSL